jgi:WD40 repeat protein
MSSNMKSSINSSPTAAAVPCKALESLPSRDYYRSQQLAPYLVTLVPPSDTERVNEADAAAGSLSSPPPSAAPLSSPRRPSHSVGGDPVVVPTKSTRTEEDTEIVPDWRLRGDRMKTVGIGLIMALNIGTEPPDIIKPHPCAKLQCWIDPYQHQHQRAKAKEIIGDRLEQQYSKWQFSQAKGRRAAGAFKYRRALDPTIEDVRNVCTRLRSQARNERILIHYNGHGVPRPSDHGEIWVFDKNKTEYIPLMVSDLKQWMGKPVMVVLDCSAAGILIPFLTMAPDETSTTANSVSSSILRSPSGNTISSNSPTSWTMDQQASQWVRDTIVLCPCSENEFLPMHPDYPADIFTSCLTTPIPMALRWFVRRNPSSMSNLHPDAVDAIPGVPNDRKTPLGELNWIFTTVTDSIAWNVLPKPLFARLFRQDLLVASMFRNFLLAVRILSSLGCTPVSFPPLPPGTAQHPLWQSWDLACETLLFQLMQDGILGNHVLKLRSSKSRTTNVEENRGSMADSQTSLRGGDDHSASSTEDTSSPQEPPPQAIASSVSSPFFSEQLAAFEVWLEFAEVHQLRLDSGVPLDPPEHLPVVVQVLLGVVHRVRSLTLLKRFLVLGPWAVNMALSLGIFPYVMKLLQSPEYKCLLVSIWASILAFDPSCRIDILKDGVMHHFVQHLMWGLNNMNVDVETAAKERALAAFVLAVVTQEYPAGQAEAIRLNLHGSCCALLSSYEQGEHAHDESVEMHLPAHFRLWLCICLGNMVRDNPTTQMEAYTVGVHQRLTVRLKDKNPDVRAAVCYAFGCLLESHPKSLQRGPSSIHDLTQQLQSGNVPFHQSGGMLSSHFAMSPGVNAGPISAGGQLPPMLAQAGLPNLSLHTQQMIGTLRNMQGGQPMHILPGGQPVTTGLPNTASGLFWNHAPMQNVSVGHGPPTSSPFIMHGSGVGVAPGSSLGSPAGFLVGSGPMMSPHGQPALMNLAPFPHSSLVSVALDAPPTMQPTTFEDRARMEFDLSSMEMVLQTITDGSVVVRYEATITLGLGVAKYLEAFVIVADELARSHANPVENAEESTADVLSLPNGLEHTDLTRFKSLWSGLRSIQRQDPFPMIAKAASDIVNVVHESLFRRKTETDDTSDISPYGNRLIDILEEYVPSSSPVPSPALRSEKSASVLKLESKKGDLRRVASETVHSKSKSLSMEENVFASSSPRVAGGGILHSDISNYSIPKSEFFEWKRRTFLSLQAQVDDSKDQDPLSPDGVTKQYRERRNSLIRDHGQNLAARYSSLAPKPPKPVKQSIEMILDEDDEEALLAAEEKALVKKRELEFKETRLCRNDGVTLTSLLAFHPFENYLMACGDTGSVSLWDTEIGQRCKVFNNENSKASRMTSLCWMNPESISHVMLGCDDGTVRIWGGLLENNGDCSSRKPRLLSSFHAAPMDARQWGSGLVTDWQPFSGTLIAGGNSRFIRCWDIEAEKVVNKLETQSDAYVTTLTTAWDQDTCDSTSSSYGIGKDVVVAGLSDGSIKLFDIRKNPVGSRPKLRSTSSSEHKTWVVTTAFTSYGGRYELISGTVSGEVKAWDLRMLSSIRTLDVQRSTMTTLAVHSKIPIIATGSDAQFVKIVTLDGDTVQVLRYHEKLASHKFGPISCLAFHPYKALLAAGATDNYIGLYGTKVLLQKER